MRNFPIFPIDCALPSTCSVPSTCSQLFAVFHPPLGGTADEDVEGDGGRGATAERRGGARSAVLLEALAGVPASMAPVVGHFLGELDAEAASSVSRRGGGEEAGGNIEGTVKGSEWPCSTHDR